MSKNKLIENYLLREAWLEEEKWNLLRPISKLRRREKQEKIQVLCACETRMLPL